MGLEIVGWIVAGVGIVCAVIAQKGRSDAQTMLEEASNRLDKDRKAHAELQELLNETSASAEQHRNSLRKVEAGLEQARVKYAMLDKEKLEVQDKLQDELRQLELQATHLREENQVLKDQLVEADRLNASQTKDLKAALLKNDNSKQEASGKRIKELETNLSSLTEERNIFRKAAITQEKSVAKLKRFIKTIDPEGAKKYKRKARHSDQLYQSMKGLKELQEERNQNLEVALRQLSHFVLGNRDTNSPFGELVGAALEKAGGVLQKDEFSTDTSFSTQPPKPESNQQEAATV